MRFILIGKGFDLILACVKCVYPYSRECWVWMRLIRRVGLFFWWAWVFGFGLRLGR